MKILGIETSTASGGVALVVDDRVVAESRVVNPRLQAEQILPMIDRLLHDAGWKLSEIDLIAISSGPGSFTGLRIGMATAKGLAEAGRFPIIGVPTLEAFAAMLAPTQCAIWPVLDARKEEVFTAPFDGKGLRTGPDFNIKPEILAETLKNEGKIMLAGDGARRYRAIFEAALGKNAQFAPSDRDDPRPGAVAILGRRLLLNGSPATIESLVPDYVRRSDAEIHSGVK